MAPSAMRSIVALVTSGDSETSSWERRAWRHEEVAVGGPVRRLGFLGQWEERWPCRKILSAAIHQAHVDGWRRGFLGDGWDLCGVILAMTRAQP